MGNSKTRIYSRWRISWKGEIRIINEWKFKFLKTKSLKTRWKSSHLSTVRIEPWKRRERKKEKWSIERVIRRTENQWVNE
jgi:hypothetical protein